jgi:hypothetical protein
MSYNHLRTIVGGRNHDIMEDDTARPAAIHRLRQRRGLGATLVLVGLVATVGLLASACGGGSQDPGVASAGRTTTTVAPSGSSSSDSSGETSQSEQLQFAQCMRSHRVPNFPDPSPGGGLLNAISAAGINTHSPTYQAAAQACEKYTPAANMTPAQSAAENTKGLEFSQCMRSHGVPNFPDPITGPTGGQAINLTGLGIDQNSPTYQAANQACQSNIPSGK